MNDLKEQAKKIIAKGKLLNDPELLKMGLDMLDAYQETPEDKPMEKEISSGSDFTAQFRVTNNSTVNRKYGKKIQLAAGERPNLFVDDGKQFAELKGITPPPQPKEKRKNKTMQVVCTICGKKDRINKDLLFTEAYRCNTCILKGKIL